MRNQDRVRNGQAREVPCLLFDEPGPRNTEKTLERAAARASELGIKNVVIATTSGKTALKALDFLPPGAIVAVSHSTGFSAPNMQELRPEYRRRLEEAGARVLTCQHAFGGVGRAVRKKLGTYELEEIIAYSLRTFGQGTKVAIEVSLMAADAGLVPVGEPCVAVGGTETGADTALVLKPVNSQSFFDLRVMEIIAKPR
jgi:hypothetical protein